MNSWYIDLFSWEIYSLFWKCYCLSWIKCWCFNINLSCLQLWCLFNCELTVELWNLWHIYCWWLRYLRYLYIQWCKVYLRCLFNINFSLCQLRRLFYFNLRKIQSWNFCYLNWTSFIAWCLYIDTTKCNLRSFLYINTWTSHLWLFYIDSSEVKSLYFFSYFRLSLFFNN